MKKTYKLVGTGAERHWSILDGDAIVGTVEQRQTGFLVTEGATGKIVKRYRMIDALEDIFGTESEFVTIE